MCCTGMDHRRMMPLPILYRLMRYLLSPIAVPMRRELSKNAELLVLRPEKHRDAAADFPRPLHVRRPYVAGRIGN